MRRTSLFLILAGFVGTLGFHLSGQTAPSKCQSAARLFLKAPDEYGLASLDKSGCWDVIGSSNDNLDRLNNLAATGNKWAARYLAEHLKGLDGGNLEDALIALGQFSNHDMEDLLIFANKGLLSTHDLADALTMLPLTLTDDSRAQLNFLEERRHKLLRVNRTDLQEQRRQGLAAISEAMSEIRSNQ